MGSDAGDSGEHIYFYCACGYGWTEVIGGQQGRGPWRFSETDDLQAFPVHYSVGAKSNDRGMTLRDYFAGQALTALVHVEAYRERSGGERKIARKAYAISDAVLKERGQLHQRRDDNG